MEVHYATDFEAAAKLGDKVRTLYSVLVEEAPKLDRPFYSILLWPKNVSSAQYLSAMPETYGELAEFALNFGMDLKATVSRFCALRLKIIGGIPVILMIVRPQPLIGSNSPFEFLPFVILGSPEYQGESGEILSTAPVWALSHRRPLTTAFARELSSVPETLADKSILLVGCGAEGSKIGLHLGRAGLPRIHFVDADSLSPHNLVRHALLPNSLAKNKATALKEQLDTIFHNDKNAKFGSTEQKALEVIRDVHSFDLVVDATASAAVLETLIREDVAGPTLVRCEMADAGRIGYLLVEGPNRLPRLDDLQVQLYDLGFEYTLIANWLSRHRDEQFRSRGPVLEDIGIGISCSSDTMRLPDDIISYHSGAFSVAIRSFLNSPPESGRIQVNSIHSGDGIEGNILTFRVEPPTVLVAQGDSSWCVRVGAAAYADLRRYLSKHRWCETGGLLVGMIHKRRKTIYVSRVLPPSRDSRGSPYAFRRGVKDYPELLDRIHGRTGNLLGYVGEWHTHPRSRAEMSEVDKEAVRQIRETLASAGIPAHIMIVAPNEMNSFVFPPTNG